MADLCSECSVKKLGFDGEDLAGLSSWWDTYRRRYSAVICEACGPILVDHRGVRVAEDTGCSE